MGTYIAVCDDNMADRKQLERLLGRESDARLHDTGVLYIDSFGSEEAVLKTPMKYDLFFVDFCLGTRDGMDVAATLRSKGVLCPIVLCSSKINYQEKYGNVSGYFYMEKPIQKQALSALLDYAISEKQDRSTFIELRDERAKSTYFVTADEILYATEDARQVRVTLTNERIAQFYGALENLNVELYNYPNFITLGHHTIVNMDYIKKRIGRAFEMTDGEILSFSFFDQKHVLELYTRYRMQK